jgi:predicted transcriptional regulator of viral defense system
MPSSERSRLRKLTRHGGIISAAQAGKAGIHSQQLTRLIREGVLERVSRGQYRLVSAQISENHGLVIASVAVPDGVICLLSALSFHRIGTQVPAEVWVALPRGHREPAVTNPPLRIVHVTGAAFETGIERHRAENVTLRVYSVAKTIADLFKHRNRIGIDVAIEALRESWQRKLFTMEELDRSAQVCRVQRVMRPYIEAIVS